MSRNPVLYTRKHAQIPTRVYKTGIRDIRTQMQSRKHAQIRVPPNCDLLHWLSWLKRTAYNREVTSSSLVWSKTATFRSFVARRTRSGWCCFINKYTSAASTMPDNVFLMDFIQNSTLKHPMLYMEMGKMAHQYEEDRTTMILPWTKSLQPPPKPKTRSNSCDWYFSRDLKYVVSLTVAYSTS